MKKFIIEVLKECFNGSPLTITKRILAYLICFVVLMAVSGADSLGTNNLILVFGTAVLLWYFCGLSDAFRDNDK